jgi:hypothetical protein
MKLECLDTADQVFDELGGYLGVAEIVGCKPNAAANWRTFKSFPANTYVALTEALRLRGKTAPAALWRMRSPSEAANG